MFDKVENSEKVVAVDGDVTALRLGLSETHYKTLCDQVKSNTETRPHLYLIQIVIFLLSFDDVFQEIWGYALLPLIRQEIVMVVHNKHFVRSSIKFK